jgi:hypothetical protein
MARMNTGTFTIYNLAEQTRKQIYQDRYNLNTYKYVILEAGYGENMSQIFVGQIRQAYSMRVGTEWQTTIEAWDGGFGVANGSTSISFPKGAGQAQVFKQLFANMPYTDTPVISGGLTGSYTHRGISFMGNSWTIAKYLTPSGYHLYIDNNHPQIISYTEYVEGGIPQISSDMGLLETPRREDANLEVKILFEPRLIIGQAVSLNSEVGIYNNQYKVVGINHSGTISEAASSDCATELNLWLGARLLQVA